MLLAGASSGISYWGPIEVAFSLGESYWTQVVADDGGFRVMIAYDTAPREILWEK